MTTIVLADDHHVMRQGLRSLLEEQPDFQVIGEAGDGQEALQLVESLQPDVLVADMLMGGMNGVMLTEQIRKRLRDRDGCQKGWGFDHHILAQTSEVSPSVTLCPAGSPARLMGRKQWPSH